MASSVVGEGIKGERYTATVPDTLDLVDRAALTINGLGRARDPDAAISSTFTFS